MTLIYIEKQKIKLFIKKLFDRQTELKNGLIHIIVVPITTRQTQDFYFYLPLVTKAVQTSN